MFHFVSKDTRSILKNCTFVLKDNHNIGKREGIDKMSLSPTPEIAQYQRHVYKVFGRPPNTHQDASLRPTRQGDALLIAGLPLAVLVQGTAPAACLLVTVVHGVILGAVLILGNGDLEHSGQELSSYMHRKNSW